MQTGLLGQEPTLTTAESATCRGGPPLLQGLSQNSTSTLQPLVKGLGPRTQGSAPAPTPPSNGQLLLNERLNSIYPKHFSYQALIKPL